MKNWWIEKYEITNGKLLVNVAAIFFGGVSLGFSILMLVLRHSHYAH